MGMGSSTVSAHLQGQHITREVLKRHRVNFEPQFFQCIVEKNGEN